MEGSLLGFGFLGKCGREDYSLDTYARPGPPRETDQVLLQSRIAVQPTLRAEFFWGREDLRIHMMHELGRRDQNLCASQKACQRSQVQETMNAV